MTIYTKVIEFDEFSFAREQFEMLVNQLGSEKTQHMEHGEVEAFIEKEGREILRQLLQAHLNLRASNEERIDGVRGKEGIERTHCRSNCKRNLATLFGEVVVNRKSYSGRGLSHVFPLDKELNLPQDKYSHGLRKKIAETVAKGAFNEACSSIKNSTGGQVPKRQLEEISQELSQDFEDYYAQCNKKIDAPSDDTILVMSCDAKGIIMRPEDLRPATRQAAKKNIHKLQTRLSRGEKRNRKRMATVAAIYDIAPHQRKAEQILYPEEEQPLRPRPINKQLWANVTQGIEETVERLLQEAKKRDPEKKRCWIMLVDGHEVQLRIVKRVIKRYRANVVVIQDFVHVLEYIWKAAYCFYPEGSEEAERFVQEHALGILKGKISEVAGGMRRSATRRGLLKSQRQAIDKCANYLLKNKERLNYAKALENGWPIATGVIEGACRYLVKDRMDITGARWSLKGAEAVLRLRALHINGHLEDYMHFHKQQEQLRHYEMAA